MYGTHYVWMGIAAIALAITPREAVFITAPQARKDLVGRGDADKTDVREKLRKRFGAQVDDLSDDTTDALCIALCKKPVAVELNYRKK